METPKEGGVKRKWSTLVHYGPQYNNCVQSWAVLIVSLIKVCSVFNAILATSPALYCFFFVFWPFSRQETGIYSCLALKFAPPPISVERNVKRKMILPTCSVQLLLICVFVTFCRMMVGRDS